MYNQSYLYLHLTLNLYRSMQRNKGDFDMFTPELQFLVYQEQHKDRLRDMQRQQLLQIAGLQQDRTKLYRQIVAWLGGRMVSWGLKLQSYVATQKDTDTGRQESPLTISMIPKS